MTPEGLEKKIAEAILEDDPEKVRRIIRVIREYLTIPHNHPTREIREPGVCPGCDSYWYTQAEKEEDNG